MTDLRMTKVQINPDHYLETPTDRLWTPERSKLAWASAYHDFEQALVAEHAEAYIVFGVQGSRKSTWIECHVPDSAAVYFDAALPAKRHRMKAVQIAKAHAKRVTAVWVDVPLKVALERNRQRPQDEVVPADALSSVFDQLEAPEHSEGFDSVILVRLSGEETEYRPCSEN